MQADTLENLVRVAGALLLLLLLLGAFSIIRELRRVEKPRVVKPRGRPPQLSFMCYLKMRNPISWQDWRAVIFILGLKRTDSNFYETKNYDNSVQFLFQNDAQGYVFNDEEPIRGLWVSTNLPQPAPAPEALENFLILVKRLSNHFKATIKTVEGQPLNEQIAHGFRIQAEQFLIQQQMWNSRR